MAKNVANLVDSFYQLFVSTDGEDFKKVEHLTKCSVPSDEKVLDDVTATDDKRTIKAVVDFKKSLRSSLSLWSILKTLLKSWYKKPLTMAQSYIFSLSLSKHLASRANSQVLSLNYRLIMKIPRKSCAKLPPLPSQAMSQKSLNNQTQTNLRGANTPHF